MITNLELYRAFYVTAKTGSVSKAAKELFTSQPAMSQAVKSLERKLDAQLFHRTPKGMMLTSDGEFLFRYVAQWYGLVKTAEQKLFELKNMAAGQIRIAVCSAICNYHLVSYLEKFCLQYPSIKVFIQDQPSKEIVQALETGVVDIGVINLLNTKYGSSLHIVQKFQIQDCFVAGSKFHNALRNELSIQTLVEHFPILLLEKGSSTRAYIDQYFAAHEVEFEPQMELGTLELLLAFTKRGLGISCVTKEHVQVELDANEIFEVPVIQKIPARIMGIAHSNEFPLSTATQAFIKILLANE
ncbi:MAG: LysR family transcriptional regulator [Oscillospiraceae bacterium]|nr:LysR family transcriptional regulator [Oscillospiraceae bacterium]